MKNKINIREAKVEDSESLWQIISLILKEGDTYVFAPDSSKKKMMANWIAKSHHTFVAEIDHQICGTYILKENQPDLGSHIANGSYMVDPKFQGLGIGKSMGRHSIKEAKKLGYDAIQFNMVLKSNHSAVNLWKKLGFEIVGEVPDAFQHPKHGLTNAYIMYRKV